MKKILTVTDHHRDFSGLRYIYPVVSRRAGGVSIGINLNTNNACNWRCIYCNVPNLTRGTPPPVDLQLLEQELRGLLAEILDGDFMPTYVSPSDRQLKDIAFSGNGEPTSATAFPAVVTLVTKLIKELGLLGNIKLRLITNGSMMHKPIVIDAVEQLAKSNGEVWFKLDAGTQADIAKINDVQLNPDGHLARLKQCAAACPTYVQTCLFKLDETPPSEAQLVAYLDCIAQVKDIIAGVHLYGIARQSMQAEAERLSPLSITWFEAVASRIRQHHPNVFVNP